jgi:tetratricopeptide (TPR) repeat protein
MMVGLAFLLMQFAAKPLQTVVEGDSAFNKINYPAAISIYEAVLEKTPTAAVMWRLARVYVCAGDVAAQSEREAFYQKAEGYARRCVEQNPALSDGHTWLAAALGNLALYKGGNEKIKLSTEIKQAADRALQLNPKDDIAYSILGSFYRSLGGVGWFERQMAGVFLGGLPDGGYTESETALKKAIDLSPRTMRHHYELGLLYIDWNRLADARAALQKAQQCPVMIAADKLHLAQIRKLLGYIDQQLH